MPACARACVGMLSCRRPAGSRIVYSCSLKTVNDTRLIMLRKAEGGSYFIAFN